MNGNRRSNHKTARPAWTQTPLSKTPTRALAQRLVARGWVKSEAEAYIELSDRQKASREEISRKTKETPRPLNAWRAVPLSEKLRR